MSQTTNLSIRSNAETLPVMLAANIPKRVSVTLSLTDNRVIARRAECRGISINEYMGDLLTARLGKSNQTVPFMGKWYDNAFSEMEDRFLEDIILVIVGFLKAGMRASATRLILQYMRWPQDLAEAEESLLHCVARDEERLEIWSEILKKPKQPSIFKQQHGELRTVVSELAKCILDETRLSATSTVGDCLLEILRLANGRSAGSCGPTEEGTPPRSLVGVAGLEPATR
jgi:hypothetical protein